MAKRRRLSRNTPQAKSRRTTPPEVKEQQEPPLYAAGSSSSSMFDDLNLTPLEILIMESHDRDGEKTKKEVARVFELECNAFMSHSQKKVVDVPGEGMCAYHSVRKIAEKEHYVELYPSSQCLKSDACAYLLQQRDSFWFQEAFNLSEPNMNQGDVKRWNVEKLTPAQRIVDFVRIHKV